MSLWLVSVLYAVAGQKLSAKFSAAGSPGDEWRLVAYASDQAHSCVRKACMVAGVRHFRAVHTRAEDHHCMR